MSAFIPIKSDPIANDAAIAQVRADKEREATDGHDGTWVAHPGLVPVAKEVFDRIMPQPNQIAKQLPGLHRHARRAPRHPHRHHHLLGLPQAQPRCSALGLPRSLDARHRLRPSLQPDGRRRHSREISRAQLWQWVHHHAILQDPEHAGQPVTAELCNQLLDAEVAHATTDAPPARVAAYHLAATLMRNLIDASAFESFLTLPAYTTILQEEGLTT